MVEKRFVNISNKHLFHGMLRFTITWQSIKLHVRSQLFRKGSLNLMLYKGSFILENPLRPTVPTETSQSAY
jgi:hypothetical protein